MAYEVEAIDSSTSPKVPIVQAPLMREERVVTPNSSSGRIEKAQAAVSQKTGQIDKSGVTTAVEPAKTAETVTLTPQAAALARKEQKFRQEQAELKKQAAALEADRASIAEYKAMKEKLAAKDYSGIEGLVSYEDYTKYLIEKANGEKPEAQALKKLEDKVTSIEQKTDENLKKQFEAAVNERRVATEKLLETSNDFEELKKLDALKKDAAKDAVVQHILDTWEHDSKELTVEEAAKEVKEVVIERAKKWASILAKEEPKEAPVEEQKKPLPVRPAVKTLTNQMTVTETKRPVKPLQGMTDAERWAEARRRTEEKLKQGIR